MRIAGRATDPTQDLTKLLLENGQPETCYRILLSPELAAEFLGRMRTNRPAKVRTVLNYRSQLRADRWGFTGQPLIFNTMGQMMDGQHRCLAIIAEKVTVEVLVVIGVDDEAFRYIDQGAMRSGGDILHISGNGAIGLTNRLAAAASGLLAHAPIVAQCAGAAAAGTGGGGSCLPGVTPAALDPGITCTVSAQADAGGAATTTVAVGAARRPSLKPFSCSVAFVTK